MPPVVLFTYQLTGTITDAAGKPVVGAIVVTRTQDRDFWTFSKPTDASGHYTSFFAASDESGADPVPLTVQVASGSGVVLVGRDSDGQVRRRSRARPSTSSSPAARRLSWRCRPRRRTPARSTRDCILGRVGAERPDQAALGELARQERALPDHAAGVRSRQEAEHLGGPRPGLLVVPGDAGREVRHAVVPDARSCSATRRGWRRSSPK